MTPPPTVTVPVSDLEYVRDLLMERVHGSPARSPGHNARLTIESMLSAAPQPGAPSSLAGGEVREIIAELGDYLIADRRKKSLTIPKDLGRRVLAALSPEAPAREGVWSVGDRVELASGGSGSIVNVRYGVAMDLEDGAPDLGWAPKNFLDTDAADFIEALTPRHEAPAEGAGECAEVAQIVSDTATGEFDGAGSGFYVTNPDEVAVAILSFLRARSSAPEAREGAGPVEWRWRIEGVDGWRRCGGAKPHFATSQPGNVVDLQPLYTHPAAPSADKLREALTDLLAAVDEVGVRHWDSDDNSPAVEDVIFCSDKARQALSALRAEGAK